MVGFLASFTACVALEVVAIGLRTASSLSWAGASAGLILVSLIFPFSMGADEGTRTGSFTSTVAFSVYPIISFHVLVELSGD